MKRKSISQFMVLLAFIMMLSLKAFSCNPPSPAWDYINTGNNHSIAIPPASTITCDGAPIAIGDVIGVFYNLVSGGTACAGWVNYTGGMIAMTAWGDDATTGGVKEGYYANETFQWRVYKCSTSLVYYQSSIEYVIAMPNQGNFATGGLSQLTSLATVSMVDLSITGWVGPNTGCNLGANEQVKVNIYNIGPGPGSNFTMAYSVNGGAPVTQLYTETAIAVGSSALFTFTQTVNMSAVTTYNFSVTVTASVTDPVSTNNTITHSTEKTAPPSVSLSGIDTHYCFDPNVEYTPIPLTGTPPGGSFESESFGLAGTSFILNFANMGINELRYVYNDSVTGCTGIDTVQVNLTAYPTATFTGFTSNHYCIYENIQLTGDPSGGTFFGSTYINAGNSFNPLTPGLFNIGYAYTDIYGCSDTSNISPITVNSLPPVDVISPLHAYCLNQSGVVLNGSPLGGYFSISTSGGSSITLPNIFNPNIAGLGIHQLTYHYTNPTTGCSNTKNFNVKVFALPLVDFSGLDTEYCQDTTPVILNGSPTGGTWTGTWLDNIFKPLTVGTMNVTYGYTQSYQYYGDTIGCLNTKTRSTVVHALPVIDISTGLTLQPDGHFETAAPDTVHLNAGPNWTSYIWSNGATVQNIITSGYGWYSVTVTNGFMCAGHDSLFIGGTDLTLLELVSPKSNCVLGPEETVTAKVINSGTKTFVTGQPVFFEYKINNGTVVSEQEYLPVDIPPDSTFEHTFSLIVNNLDILEHIGAYTFRVAVTYLGNLNYLPDVNPYNDTLYVLVENGGLPVMTDYNVETNEPDSGVVLDAGDFAEYLWNTAENTQAITVIDFGTYTVTVTDEFGCTTSGSFSVNVIDDVNPLAYRISLYPSPNDGMFNLSVTAPNVTDFNLTIMNIEGKEIYSEMATGILKLEKRLDLSYLPAGVYYLNVSGDSGCTIRKFVKQ